MTRQLIYETKDLVDAGAFSRNVLARCPCGHWAILDSIDLWGLFQRRGWIDVIPAVAMRLRCSVCKAAGRPKRRPTVELVRQLPTVKLPWCDTTEFKRAVRRRR